MIDRKLQQQIEESLQKFPVVGLIGARQVGKTTLANMLAPHLPGKIVCLDLERPSDLVKLTEAELYLESHSASLVILDEVQRKPEIFPLLRALVDADRKNGRFLILGSASPDLIRQSSESLAGRIIYHELSPFSLAEVGTSNQNAKKLWLRGGYPQSFLARIEKDSYQWRESFIQTHLERDLPNLGLRVPAQTLRRFWTMLAHFHGQLWNAQNIGGSLGVSGPTVRNYLDILKNTFMVRELQPLHANLKKRLVKSSKVYLRDSGLLHSLLRIQDNEDLLGHPSAGASWEGFIIEQVLSIIPTSWEVCFYRTSAGAEIDLVLMPSSSKAPIAIEVKYSLEPKPTRGFWTALSDIGCEHSFVVYPGEEFYPLGKNAYALPVCELGRLLEL